MGNLQCGVLMTSVFGFIHSLVGNTSYVTLEHLTTRLQCESVRGLRRGSVWRRMSTVNARGYCVLGRRFCLSYCVAGEAPSAQSLHPL